MAAFNKLFLVTLIAGMVLLSFSAERIFAQTPPSGCSKTMMSLSPCLSYMNSNVTIPPTSSCCNALSSVVKTSGACLCTLFASTNPLGFPVNQTRALALPGACKIATPPLSKCNASGAAPASAPKPSAPTGAAPASAPKPSAPKVAEAPAPTGVVSTPNDISPSPDTTTTTTTGGAEGPTASTSSGHLEYVANKFSLVGVVGIAVTVMGLLA